MNNTIEIIKRLRKEYDGYTTALNYKTPFQLLLATILSAQCTDKRVNIVTKELFKKYKTPKDFANLANEELEPLIKSTGFYKNKAKNIIAASKKLQNEFNSQIPDNMEDLLKLPGVARKTANIVLHYAYGIEEGIAVDTHVKRVAYRLGLTKNTNPDKIEKDLINIIPKEYWKDVNNLIVWHGRLVCKAQKPDCDNCIINDLCAFNISK